MRTSQTPGVWINWSIHAGAGFFIFALIASAVFDPTIRVLHVLQALIYIAVILLTRKVSAWGYGAGFVIAAFWNYTNLVVTSFIAAGVQQLTILIRSGHVERPDLLIAVIAAAGHFTMMAGCLAGFLRTKPTGRVWLRFAAGGAIALAYFFAIILTTGPQYVRLLKRVFGLPA